MLRVARIARANYTALDAGPERGDLSELERALDQLRQLLQRRVPASALSIFARPLAASDPAFVDWVSDLEGQPLALAMVPEPARGAARALLDQRVQLLAQALDQIEAREPAQSPRVASLRPLLAYPGDESVYVLNGEPVITFWGHRRRDALPPVPPAGAPAAAAGVAAAAPVVAAAAAVAPRRRRWWPWLLGALLLLLLLLALLCWLWWCREPVVEVPPAVAEIPAPIQQPPVDEPPPEPPAVPEPPVVPPDPLLGLGAAIEAADCAALAKLLADDPRLQPGVAGAEPLRQIAGQRAADCQRKAVEDRVKAAAGNCAALEKIRTGEAALAAPADDGLREIRNQLDQSLKDCKRAQEQEKKEKEEEQKLAACPGKRPPEQAPEVVVLFDASGSMEWAVDMTDAEGEQYQQQREAQAMAQALGQLFGLPGGGVAGAIPVSRQRITAAKSATRAVVQSLPSDVSVGMVLIRGCPVSTSVGFYPPAQRAGLLSQLDSVSPQGGTPLGDGVRRAAAMVDGRSKDAVMVVLSDGRDSCEVDPCAVAAQIARSQPRLKINVVDIQGNGAGACLARATGGRLYSATSADEVAKVTREAAQDAAVPAHCK